MHHSAGEELSMGKAIGAADMYIKSIGLSIHPLLGPQPDGPNMKALLDLGLDPKLVEALTGDFETEVKAMMQYLQ
jgi:hypothetical protein